MEATAVAAAVVAAATANVVVVAAAASWRRQRHWRWTQWQRMQWRRHQRRMQRRRQRRWRSSSWGLMALKLDNQPDSANKTSSNVSSRCVLHLFKVSPRSVVGKTTVLAEVFIVAVTSPSDPSTSRRRSVNSTSSNITLMNIKNINKVY